MNPYYQRKNQLLIYLHIYLSKRLRMEWIILGMIKSLNNNDKITQKQINSIMSFIERETPFISMSRTQIVKYFSPLIGPKQKEAYNGTTLCQFLQ